MRISEVAVYSHDDDVRTIEFNPSGLNIITGESKSGKSAIIHIVDYCLGSKNCHVPLGEIRNHVSWFAIRLILDEGSLFIARKNPPLGQKSSQEIFLSTELDTVPKTQSVLEANANVDGLRRVLTSAIGIDENLHIPGEGQTRDPLEANFRHSLVYCFQDQSLIDNKNQLFFLQNDSFIEMAIRDTLPYFLGAVDEQEVLSQRRLAGLKRRLKQIEKRIALAVSWQDAAIDKAQSLVAESRNVRLLGPEERPVSPDAVFELLSTIPDMKLGEAEFMDSDGELERLEDERDSLRTEYFAVGKRIEDAKSLSASREDYGSELLEQRARLALLPEPDERNVICPLCGSEDHQGDALLATLRSQLEDVSGRLADLQVHGPRLQAHISSLEERQRDLRERISISQAQINAIIQQIEMLRETRDLQTRQARIQGRVSAFLEQQSSLEEQDELEQLAEELRRSIKQIESGVSGEDFYSRLRNAEANLEQLMTDFARDLSLEHSAGRTRLDFRKLTVVAETKSTSIPLEDMGSGDNWVGYHVVAHMALHHWFRSRSRPVPSFIFFDQPSKAHYPPELEDLSGVEDDDRASVVRLFNFMYEKSAMESDFQTIVLDHADEKEQWFQDSVVQRWRDGEKLIPSSWIIRNEL